MIQLPEPAYGFGRMLLSGVVGSTAYGLAHAGSDIDRLGVFAAPPLSFGSLAGPGPESIQTHGPDTTVHEARKFLRLALACNPTVSELLWLSEYENSTPLGEELVGIRAGLLSAQRVRDAYLGYATGQFRRLTERGDGSFSSDLRQRTAKHARHLYRLCWQGLHLYRAGELQLRLDDPQEFRDFGDQVAAGDIDVAKTVMALYEHKFDTSRTVLPTEPDRDAAVRWLDQVRTDSLPA